MPFSVQVGITNAILQEVSASCAVLAPSSGHAMVHYPLTRGWALQVTTLDAPVTPETRGKLALLIDHMAEPVARAEALPHDELRKKDPRTRCLEDARLDRPELIIGCWASG